MKRELSYQEVTIEYLLKQKKQKHLYLKYRYPNLIISAPKGMSLEIIEAFLISNWSRLLGMLNLNPNALICHQQVPYVYFQGIKYPLKINTGSTANKVIFSDNAFSINITSNNKTDIAKYLHNYLRKQATLLLPQRVAYYAQIMNLTYNTVAIRLMTAKWGLCHFLQKKIVLNYKIMHFNQEVIDYLIIHELAHLKFPNHSKLFWNFVKQYCPDYKNHQQTLKQVFH